VRDLPGARVHVVPNGVELDAIAATPPLPRAALGLPDDCELVVYAGRFVPAKNIPLLAASLTALLQARPRAVALACGHGEERAPFVAELERAGLGARCLAPGYRDDLWAVLKAADVVIGPSRHEGRPNVVLEAMAAGAPLVLSDIAQHGECVPRDAALWFARESAAEATAALARALDDKPAARARAERALAAVRGQSVDAMARAYAALYRRVAAPASASRVSV
jgi:starch synthase (maltosyl-transferring)